MTKANAHVNSSDTSQNKYQGTKTILILVLDDSKNPSLAKQTTLDTPAKSFDFASKIVGFKAGEVSLEVVVELLYVVGQSYVFPVKVEKTSLIDVVKATEVQIVAENLSTGNKWRIAEFFDVQELVKQDAEERQKQANAKEEATAFAVGKAFMADGLGELTDDISLEES